MLTDFPSSVSLSCAVTFTTGDESLGQKAKALAKDLRLPLIEESRPLETDLLLCYSKDGLQLRLGDKPATSLQVDFLSDSLNYRRQYGGGIKQALARAVGIKPGIRPSILDATAGLGKDAFLLAALGCRVIMAERSPILAALLRDGLERAGDREEMQEIMGRLTLLRGEATAIMSELRPQVDTIYLDPMYPHSKKSALNRQEMRIIRTLVGDDRDAGKLLDSALCHAGKRVVVKRPKGAPRLTDQQPSHTIKMKNSRYDVYMI